MEDGRPSADPELPRESILAAVGASSADITGILTDRVKLFSLELRRATAAVGQMAALGALPAVFCATPWTALWIGFAAAAVTLGLAWEWVVFIVPVINIAAGIWALLRIKPSVPLLTLPATLRSLTA